MTTDLLSEDEKRRLSDVEEVTAAITYGVAALINGSLKDLPKPDEKVLAGLSFLGKSALDILKANHPFVASIAENYVSNALLSVFGGKNGR